MLAALAEWLFDPAGLTPHGFCLTWQPGLIWLHAVAGTATALAYFTIPVALSVLARRRSDLQTRAVIRLFVAFILLCGVGHLLDVMTLWVAAYGLAGLVKGATAVVSVGTAVVLWRMLPQALAWPTPTQMREAERALAEARERIAFELSPIAKCILDARDAIVDVSESWATLFGRPREAMIGRRLGEFMPPAAPDWSPQERLGLAAGRLHHRETRFLHRDGAVIEALVSARARPGQPGVVCAVMDISDRKRAEAALRSTEDRLQQSQKMEAIGALAAGVAHDFNNILQAVVGSLEAAMDEVPQDAPARQFMDIALRAASRGSSLTQRLLAYARKQMLQPQPVLLVPFLEDVQALLRRTLGPQVEVNVAAPPAACVLADPGQLETALLNLAINAAHAMPQGGTLRIEAHEEQEEGRPCTVLTVTDTGTGMDAATLARAMDPFFSTKGAQGTGLGLSMVQGFAEQSGGRLRLMSVPGEGTTVRLSLPATPACDEARRGIAMPAPTGRLLLVDDAGDVLETTGAFLEQAGFKVLRSDSGARALALLAAQGPVDALVTDYAMGGMNGAALAAEARAIQPDLPVLLITGFADLRHDALIPADMPVLCKPFQRAELVAALAKLMRRDRVGVPGG